MLKKNSKLLTLLVLFSALFLVAQDENYVPLYQRAELRRDYTENELAAKHIIFRRNPEELHRESFPQSFEQIDKLEQLAIPGEYCNIYFMLHFSSKAKLKGWQLSDNITNIKVQWNNFEVALLKRLQGTLPYYTYMPDRFIDYQERELKEGENLLCWVQGKIPENCPEGLYNGEISIHIDNNEYKLPISIRVLPFKLEVPEHDWLMYCTTLQKNMTYEENVRMLEEIRELGVTGIVQHQGLISEDAVKKFWSMIKDSGLTTRKVVLDFGAILDWRAIHQVYKRGPLNRTITPYAECANPAVMGDFMRQLLQIEAWMQQYGDKDIPWWFQGIDEPQCNGLMGLALWEYPLVKKINIKTSATVYPYDAVKELAAAGLDISINGGPARSSEDNEKYMQLGEQMRLQYWNLGAGCYRQQQGSIAINRMLAGWIQWQSKMPAHVSWTYSWTNKEFETGKYSYCMAYPREDKSNRVMDSTLHLEGFREGIIDYKMVAMLDKLIKEAEKQKLGKEAETARKTLDDILNEQIKWGQDLQVARDISAKRSIDNDILNKLRWILAEEIMTLRGAVK